MLFSDQWQDTVCAEEPLRPGTGRFGLRMLARLSGDDRRGVDLGADAVRGDLAAVKHAAADCPDREVAARLEHEHRILRALDHPGIRRSLGWRRERAGLRTSATAVLLRFIDGATLDRWESPDLPTLCRTMSTACRALSHVHERGYVHGDLRPRHVVVDGRDHPSIISFGHAVRAGTRYEIGSVAHPYVAPERLDGGIATPRTDVFGLGATLAAVLLRGPLSSYVPGESASARRDRHESWEVELTRAGVHAPLRRLVLKAVHPDPLRRPAFVEAIGSHLEDLADTLARHRRLAA
jgi:serine/threonine protein kinase